MANLLRADDDVKIITPPARIHESFTAASQPECRSWSGAPGRPDRLTRERGGRRANETRGRISPSCGLAGDRHGRGADGGRLQRRVCGRGRDQRDERFAVGPRRGLRRLDRFAKSAESRGSGWGWRSPAVWWRPTAARSAPNARPKAARPFASSCRSTRPADAGPKTRPPPSARKPASAPEDALTDYSIPRPLSARQLAQSHAQRRLRPVRVLDDYFDHVARLEGDQDLREIGS